MTVNNNYPSIQTNKKQQPSFGNALAPVVGFATFIENNGFLGEFLTVDTVGMAAPRTIQGYNRNKEELGHPNYKAGREEMVRELLSGPAFFFVPAGVLAIAAILKGKATKITTGTLDVFKGIMAKASKHIPDMKNSSDVKKQFVDNFISSAFDGYKNERGQVDKIKTIITNMIDHKGPLFFDKVKKEAKKDISEALTILNKANGKFTDDTSLIEFADEAAQAAADGKKPTKTLGIVQMISDIPNYLENFTKAATSSSEPIGNFIDTFHKKAKLVRQTSTILAATALASFLVVIPKLYQTGKEFPGLEGLDTKNAKAKKTSKGGQK